MKKLISFLFLLVAIGVHAATVEKSTTLWSGTQVCTDSWSGYVKLKADLFSNLNTGDRLEVVVTELSETCSDPKVMLNNSSWKSFDDQSAIELKDLTLPASVRFTFTESDVETIKSGGLVVKGCGFTMTTISLITDVETGDPSEKGDYATRIWEGEEVISWTEGSSNWVKIAADKFANAKVGNKVRMNFTNLQMSAQGRILNKDWKKWDDAPTVSPLSGVYYEYTITEAMLADMQASGMIVSGIRFTLTSVDIIDTSKQWLVTSEYDQSDIRAWLPGEQPKFTFKLKNLETVDVTVSLALSLSTDTWTHLKDLSETVTLSAGESRDVALEYTVDPGFYRLTATANGELVAAYTVGYDPENVLSPSDAQSDFAEYWKEAKEELAGVEPEFTIIQEMTDYSTSNRKVYLVSMKSTPDEEGGTPVTIRGYYAEPVEAGTYPAVIHFQGTDGGKSTPWCMGGDDNPDWCELIISTRGQMLNNRDPYKDDNVYGSDYYSYGFYDKHKHYYRGAYLDCVRAMDFMQSREKVDKQNVFAAGGSQGGAFCYALAGLDQRVRAIAPSITGHSDFPDDVKIVNWPGNKFTAAQDSLKISDEEMFAFLSYYDVKNFAPYVECPVITAFSLQDTTDPPHVNVAPYNNLSQIDAADKEYIVNPFLGHSTHSGWSDDYMEFFNKHMYSASSTEGTISIATAEGYATYYDDCAYVMPTGLTGHALTVNGSSLVDVATYNEGATVPAKTALLIQGDEGDYTFSYTTTTDETPTDNMLYGNDGTHFDTNGNSLLGTGYKYYKLCYNTSGTDLGFYWGAADGAVFKNQAHRAILAVDSSVASAKGYSFGDTTALNGIENMGENLNNSAVYTLSGVRINSKNLPAGLYVQGGKKFIVK